MMGRPFSGDKRLTLSQELKQRLELRPDLKVKQIIKAELLTLPILELSNRITQEIIQNPALEIEEMSVDDDVIEINVGDEYGDEFSDSPSELYETEDISKIDEELYEYIPQHYGGHKDFSEVVEADPIIKSASSFTDYLMEQYRIHYPYDDTDLVETVIYSLSENGLFDLYIDELYFYFIKLMIDYIKSELSAYYDIEVGIDDCCYRENTHAVYKGKQILSIEILAERRRRNKDRIHLPNYRIFIERGDRILNIFVHKDFEKRIRNFIDYSGDKIKKVDHRVIDGVRYSIISVDNLMLFSWWNRWINSSDNIPPIMYDLEKNINSKIFREGVIIRSIIRDIFSLDAINKFVNDVENMDIEIIDAEQYVINDNYTYYVFHTTEEGEKYVRLIFSPLNNKVNQFISDKKIKDVDYDESAVYFYIPAGLIFYYKIIDISVEDDMTNDDIVDMMRREGILLKKTENYSIKENTIVVRHFKYNIRFYFNGRMYKYKSLINVPHISLSNVGDNLVVCVDKWAFIRSVLSDGYIEDMYENIRRIIKNIQSLSPPGVGQFSFKDVIVYQMDVIKDNPPDEIKNYENYEEMIDLCKNAIYNHYEEILKGDISNIPEMAGVSEDFIRELFSYINPYPSSGQWGKESAPSIVPDVTLKFIETYNDGKINIDIVPIFNKGNLPNIKLRKDFLIYYKLLRGEEEELRNEYGDAFIEKKKRELSRWIAEKSKTDMTSQLKKWVENGQSLLNSYYERDRILKGIIEEIIRVQRDFLLDPSNEKNLKPLSMKEVAQKLNVNESTISRAANSKYVETPYGIFPLSKFFTRSLYKDDGEQISRNKVKTFIKEIIDKEDKTRPLSDEEIADIMSREYNISIKRRTVAKYREEMGIPSSRKRRKK